MNIDASLAKAVTKFANKKMKSIDTTGHISPFYRARLEKAIAKAAANGEYFVKYYDYNGGFYDFLSTIKNELKKERFKIKHKNGEFVISWR